MKKFLAWLALLLSVGLLCFAVYISYDNIAGAFGSGPPYYSQTTNMDKWQKPIPYLNGFNLFSLLVAFLLTRRSFKVLRARAPERLDPRPKTLIRTTD